MDKSLRPPFEGTGGRVKWGHPFCYRVSELESTEWTKAAQEVAHLYQLGDRNLFWRWGRTETGVLKVDFVCRTPYSACILPHRPEVMQVFAGCRDHIESKAVLMSGVTRWRYWVTSLTSKESRIQALLLGIRSDCGCDTWLDPGTSSEVYESLRKGLKRLDQSS